MLSLKQARIGNRFAQPGAPDDLNNAFTVRGSPKAPRTVIPHSQWEIRRLAKSSQGDAKTGVSGFNKLVSVNHVPVVISSISSVVLAVAPIANQTRVVLINSSAISPKICDQATDFLFSFMVSGAQEAQFMAQSYAEQHSEEPIAILYSNNASGIDTKNVFVRDLVAHGGKIAAEESYDLNTSDFRTQLAKIKASHARNGYLIAFSSAEFARILRQSKELDLKIQWFSYSGIETQETLQLAGPAAEGVLYSYPETPNPAQLQTFLQRYSSKYNSWPDIYTVTSYDAVELLSKILAHDGTSSEQVQKGLRDSATYQGLFGSVRFGSPQRVSRSLIWKTVQNGSFTLLKSGNHT